MQGWTKEHTLAAARQGWCLSEVRCNGHAPWELQRWDDAESVSRDYGIPVPQLDGDENAVRVLKAAWDRNEPHAVLAHELLRVESPEEFELWGMEFWQKSG